MRRRAGVLLPLEVDILRVSADARRAGDPWVHGFAVARMICDATNARRLTGHGTLYKALSRLAETGLLEDHWEDPDAALAEKRPRRRLYQITGEGQRALAAAPAEARERRERVEPRIAPA